MVFFPHESLMDFVECSGKMLKKGLKTGEKLCVGKLAKKGLTNI